MIFKNKENKVFFLGEGGDSEQAENYLYIFF